MRAYPLAAVMPFFFFSRRILPSRACDGHCSAAKLEEESAYQRAQARAEAADENEGCGVDR